MFRHNIFQTNLAILLAATALTACSSTDSVDDNQSHVLAFSVPSNWDSRAALTSNESFLAQGNKFAVWATQTSTYGNRQIQIFDAQQVEYSGSVWTYSPVQYWFPSNTYSFVAIHPATAADAPSYSNNQLSFTYNYPADYTTVPDFLVATHSRIYNTGKTDAVSFDFAHIMARVNFTAKVENSVESEVVLKSISLQGVLPSATYSVTPVSATSSVPATNQNNGSWTVDASQSPITLFTLSLNQTVESNGSYEFFGADNPLLVIPQELTTSLILNVTYTLGGEEKEVVGYLYNTTVTAHGGVWNPGQTYSYSFTITEPGRIIFAVPTVSGWTESEGGNYVITD